jgi:membrane-associated phospholipid phosphatase
MRRALASLAFVLLASAASAQSSIEKAADWTSTGLVGVNMAGEAIYSIRHHCVKDFLLKNGLSVVSAEGLKLVVHEDRPNHFDKKSWPSEHSWLAAMNTGWSYKLSWTFAFGAGAGRVISNYHNPWDVASGLLIGGALEHFFPCSEN